jgi:uncharacterized membrane protein
MAASEFREDDRYAHQLSHLSPAFTPSQFNDRHEARRRNGGEVERAERLARALGWFSICLGMTEVAAPAAVARLAGLNGNRRLIRTVGLREILHGVGILCRRKPVGWLWSRVFGDVLDLAVLGRAAVAPNTNKGRVAAAAAAVTGVTVLDFQASQELTSVADRIAEDDSIHVAHSVLISRPAEDVYRFWRDFKNLPQVMKHLAAVEIIDDKCSRWVAKGPAGKSIEWNAEITADRPDELIAWHSMENSIVNNSGSVKFAPAPGRRGTIVRVELNYHPPAGVLGATIAKLLGEEPQLQLKDDLRRLKQVMEAGEILTTEDQPAGRAVSTSWKYDQVARRLAAAF